MAIRLYHAIGRALNNSNVYECSPRTLEQRQKYPVPDRGLNDSYQRQLTSQWSLCVINVCSPEILSAVG